MPAHRPRNFNFMVAKGCYCFLCACRSKLFVCKEQVPAEGTTHRISSACGGFIVVPTSNFVGLFFRHTASHAATLLHHNEFFLISILLIDLFAVQFIFFCLPVCKIFVSFSLLDSKKNSYKIWNFNSTRNS